MTFSSIQILLLPLFLYLPQKERLQNLIIAFVDILKMALTKNKMDEINIILLVCRPLAIKMQLYKPIEHNRKNNPQSLVGHISH